MSDEFDNPTEPQMSAFWPLIIVIGAMIMFFGEQDYMLNRQRGLYDQQLQNAVQPVKQAQYYADKYVSLMKDLAETSEKHNAVAEQIMKDAAAQGWIQFRPNATNGASGTAPVETGTTGK